MKKENDELIIRIELLKNNSNNNINYNYIQNKDKNENIISLMKQLKIKDDKINELKEINKKNPFNLKSGEKLMTVIFQSYDSSINYALICKNTDKFSKIENMLYDKYPEYLENENYFTVNGIKINKSKTMEQNNIKFSDNIILNVYDI